MKLNFFSSRKKNDGQKLKLKLTGLHCTSCAVNIETTLEEVVGVKTVSVSYAKSECIIYFDPTQTDPKILMGEIKKLGYDSDILE